MNKNKTYKPAPKRIADAILSSQLIDDFLPPPEELIKKEENVKITISLSKSSVSFFKEKARKAGIPYQTMIKTVLDRYSSHYRNTR